MNIQTKNIISITEARKNIFDIAEKVQKLGQVYSFTEKGCPKVVMMSAQEYENLTEDLEFMKDRGFMARVNGADCNLAKGDFVLWQDVKKKLNKKHTGLSLTEKKHLVKNNKKSDK